MHCQAALTEIGLVERGRRHLGLYSAQLTWHSGQVRGMWIQLEMSPDLLISPPLPSSLAPRAADGLALAPGLHMFSGRTHPTLPWPKCAQRMCPAAGKEFYFISSRKNLNLLPRGESEPV